MNELEKLKNEKLSEHSIGRLLVDAGKIKDKDIEEIIRYAKSKGLRFGEAAVKMRLVSKDDIEQVLAVQFEYPYLMKKEAGFDKELIAAYKPFTEKVEAMRVLRGQLMLRWFSIGRKSIAITSPQNKDGRSYMTANMGIVFSQLGERTLIIDADLINARQHKIFRVNNNTGLSSLLLGRSSIDSVVQRIEAFNDLSILPAGAPPPNPQELLSRSEFSELLVALGRKYDVILIDTSAGVSRGGAVTVAKACGGTVFIGRRNRTKVEEAQGLLARLKNSRVEVIGSVLNDY